MPRVQTPPGWRKLSHRLRRRGVRTAASRRPSVACNYGTYSICYSRQVTDLRAVAQRTDQVVADARAELVCAVRLASAEGMSQVQIAGQIGRSQPEVSRLLHFHGRTPLARRVRKQASEIRRIVSEAGGSNVRVFGSVATGSDTKSSDVDLLFTMGPSLSLMELSALSDRVGDVLGASVDLVPDSAISPALRERILAEAIPL